MNKNIFFNPKLKFKIPTYTIVTIIDENTVNFRWNSVQSIVTLEDEEKKNVLSKIIEFLVENYSNVEELSTNFKISQNEILELLKFLERHNLFIYKNQNIIRHTPIDEYLQLKLKSFGSLVDDMEDVTGRIYNSKIVLIGLNYISILLIQELTKLTSNVKLVLHQDSLSDPLLSLIVKDDLHIDIKKIHAYLKNKGVKLEIINNVNKMKFEETPDLVILTSDFDDISLFERINKMMNDLGVKWILAYVDGTEMHLSSFIPGETACYKCGKTMQDALFSSDKGYIEYNTILKSISSKNSIIKKRNMITPFHGDILRGLLGVEICEILLTKEGFFTGKELIINTLSLEMELTRVLKNPRCKVCSKAEPIKAPLKDILFENVNIG